MTVERKVNDYNRKKVTGPTHFFESAKEKQHAAVVRDLITKSASQEMPSSPFDDNNTTNNHSSSNSYNADIPSSPSLKSHRLASIGYNTAAQAAAAAEKFRSRADRDIREAGYVKGSTANQFEVRICA